MGVSGDFSFFFLADRGEGSMFWRFTREGFSVMFSSLTRASLPSFPEAGSEHRTTALRNVLRSSVGTGGNVLMLSGHARADAVCAVDVGSRKSSHDMSCVVQAAM